MGPLKYGRTININNSEKLDDDVTAELYKVI